jgi:DNA-binding transcriptional LysR family regulator
VLTQLRKFDLNLLVTLDTLLRERSVTRAASDLFLSQSAMSHSLGRLRDMLGDPLLVRGPGGLALTPLAEALREPLQQAMASIERVLGAAEFDPARSTHVFALGTTDYFDTLLLPRLIEQFRTEAPHVRVLLRSVTKEHMGDDLASGQIDLAISFARKAALHARPLFTETYSCVVRAGGRKRRRTFGLDEYLAAKHVVVSPSGTFSSVVDASLAKQRLARHVALSTPRYLAAAEIVARSDLVLTVQTRLARRFVHYLPVQVLELPVAIAAVPLLMQWAARTDRDPASAWLRQRILQLGEP